MNAPNLTVKTVRLVLAKTIQIDSGVMLSVSHKMAQTVRLTHALTIIAALAYVALPIGERAGYPNMKLNNPKKTPNMSIRK